MGRGRSVLASRPVRGRVAFLVVLLLLAAACGGEKAAPGGAAKGKDAAGTPAEPPKPVICPLTAQERPPGFPVDHPALAIKIENSTAARPQAGLEAADIVYEELAEGGITRFMAVYHCSDASRVGPVRSARSVDPDILLEYAPVLFGYSGANEVVLGKVKSTKGVIDLRHGAHGAAYERVKGRRAPHNLFTSTEKLRALSDAKGAPRTGLTFRPDPAAPPAAPSPGAPPPPGTAVTFSFAGGEQVRYAYDPGSNTYLRFHGQTPHTAEKGEQLRATNVIVLKVKVQIGALRDAAGNTSPEITVTGEGDALLLTGANAVGGRWRRAALSDRTELVDGTGAPLQLSPGNTWIHLVPEDRPVAVQ